MRGQVLLPMVGRFFLAVLWMGALVGGLSLLSGRSDSTVSTRLFLVAVGLLGVFLVMRSAIGSGASVLDRVPGLITVDRRRPARPLPPGLRVSNVAWARKTEQSRRRLGRELAEIARRNGRAVDSDRPAITSLRDGDGPADSALIAAAVDEATRR